MTRPRFSAAFILFAGVMAGCLSDAPEEGPGLRGYFKDDLAGLEHQAMLDSSFKALELMKAASGNSYAYSRPFGGFFDGTSSLTINTVARGEVVKREYSSSHRDSTGRTRKGRSYTETSQVGAIEEGAPAVTLDSLYAECRAYIAEADSLDKVWLFLDRNYIIKECGSTPHGLQDAGGAQVRINGLRWEGK